MICMCVSLWAWWEVVAAHHRVHDHACCHLQADCLECGISSAPPPTLDYEYGYLYLSLLASLHVVQSWHIVYSKNKSERRIVLAPSSSVDGIAVVN